AALDELVTAGVLVTREDAYAFSQRGYFEAARRVAQGELKALLRRRLAIVFRRRGDHARAAAHLLHAGDEIEALEELAVEHRETGGFLGLAPAGARRLSPAAPSENTYIAVETRKRFLEVCDRHDWPQRERLMIRSGAIAIANQFDPSQSRELIEPQLERLGLDSGAVYWDRFADSASAAERARRCVQHAAEVYEATPVAQRVLSPREAIGGLVVTLSFVQTLARQGYERPLLERALVLAEFIALVNPRLRVFHTMTLHVLELVRDRTEVAARIRQELLAFYDEIVTSGKPVSVLIFIGRAIAIQVHGFEHARCGREPAFVYADRLEGPLFPDAEQGAISAHIWTRRAWEIRKIVHLYRGDVAEARRCQQQLDRISTRHAYTP
ncbi:MAG TPA: hypothetical protein VK509_23365, partial [Polyangiales bacterium]|nr:hypothetical protein [Polyangiales bacterium]